MSATTSRAPSEVQVREMVEAMGAKLDVHDWDRRIEYEAVAPAGMHWDGGEIGLVSSCLKGPGAAAEARRDIAERVRQSALTPCTESCGFCNAADGEAGGQK